MSKGPGWGKRAAWSGAQVMRIQPDEAIYLKINNKVSLPLNPNSYTLNPKLVRQVLH